MSKTEDRALEKYPVEMYKEVGWRCVDKNTYKRQYFVEGYEQAEKDLELGWEDIKLIVNIDKDTDHEESIIGVRNNKEHYQEVLKRFKDYKDGSKRV